jgi:hypothetical protein
MYETMNDFSILNFEVLFTMQIEPTTYFCLLCLSSKKFQPPKSVTHPPPNSENKAGNKNLPQYCRYWYFYTTQTRRYEKTAAAYGYLTAVGAVR